MRSSGKKKDKNPGSQIWFKIFKYVVIIPLYVQFLEMLNNIRLNFVTLHIYYSNSQFAYLFINF